MGISRWNHADWSAYARSTVGRSTDGIFTRRHLDPELDPRRCRLRESRDSALKPASNAIIIGLDVTGSMGMIADALARHGLGTLVEEILERRPVSDPHIMAMGIGDAWCDAAPLQVTQFEADIRIARQLERIYLEHGGGGNEHQSYNLPWYFAATRTSIDCFEKRGRKGYLFTVGDELPPPVLLAAHARRVLGEGPQTDIGTPELLGMVERMYHVFHVVVEEGSYAQRNPYGVIGQWTELLGERALRLRDHTRLAEVVVSAIQVNEGFDADAVASRSGGDALVVRFNGGAQAGHTVVTPDGRRHVFSHFGSGSFAGAATFLSRYFVANPLLFHRERERLLQLGVRPRVYLDPRAAVTTPFDMYVNTALERSRGAARHGSCGVGFGETVGRAEAGRFALTVADLARPGLRASLEAIRDRWFPQRLAQLKLVLSGEEREALLSSALLERYMEDAAAMLDAVSVADEGMLQSAPLLLFEGAQGLLLDQDLGQFPHVTRSHTGLRNAGALAASAGVARLEVYYALRPYLTRHGAGPLPDELPGPPYPGIADPTNIPNPWQGSLRFALLDLDVLQATIERDLRHASIDSSVELDRRLAVTCLDQVGGEVRFRWHGGISRATPSAFVAHCMDIIGMERSLASYGPTRSTCESVEKSGRGRFPAQLAA